MTTDSKSSSPTDAVAVIGIAGRFPGSDGLEEFWRNLCEGRESVTFFQDDQIDPTVDREDRNLSNYVRARGILDDADKFDADFFKINQREAEMMDPQQRIFLEIAWETFENAGYDPDQYDGLIGVFAGTGFNSYYTNVILKSPHLVDIFGRHQTEVVNAPDYLATRVSYKLNLKGPSLSIYTGCSTSLVSVCMACESLVNYRCDMALAGGSFIICPQNRGYLYEEGGILSKDGHTRPFDHEARGTAFSSGAGGVVLKRLQDALEDGDFIYAVILGTGLNNDGSKKMSFTAPGIDGQAEVIALAQANADINPETISYIEAHGTATPVGDPIEIAALTQAFRLKTSKRGYCAIGSVKGNIGHLDAAAGIAGLIKTILALNHRQIPPSINFSAPNPQMKLQESPFYVNDRLSEWVSENGSRRAGVSSFGVGGTNAHLILEEAPERRGSGQSRPYKLLVFSAKTEESLSRTVTNTARYLREHPDLNLADVAYTLQVGRKPFAYRRAAICKSAAEAVEILESGDRGKFLSSSRAGQRNGEVVFMFPGQGAQYPLMGREIYLNEPLFREELDRCWEILKDKTPYDFYNLVFSNSEQAKDLLKSTAIAQPAIFTFEYALAKLLFSWGIKPSALVGHSIGEYTAACLSGVFSLEDALDIVVKRSSLMQGLPEGFMTAVFLNEDEIKPYIEDEQLSLSAVNNPSICIISGPKESIYAFECVLEKEKIGYRRLHTSHAFHSSMMDPILPVFSEYVANCELRQPKMPFLSNVTGTWITPEQATDPGYWALHLRSTVRFSRCLSTLLGTPDRIFLEVGPGNTLTGLIRSHPGFRRNYVAYPLVRHPKDPTSDVYFLMKTICRIWLCGMPIDWKNFYAKEVRNRVPLPGYSFERKRYWIEDVMAVERAVPAEIQAPEQIPVEGRPRDHKSLRTVKRDSPDNIIASYFARLLGVEAVGVNDSFFDLGGSSLIALRLFTMIEREFGKRYPPSLLYKAPTPAMLAEVLNRPDYKPSWNNLVEIKRGDSRPPFFCIHAAGGNVLLYRDLANHLSSDQPFYGVQAQGLNGNGPPLADIEDMAALYLREIKAFQPKGPYLLGGYCLGGTIAYEMAQQLYRQGEEISLLVLLDTYNFSNNKGTSIPGKIYYHVQKIGFHWLNLMLLSRNGKYEFVREKAAVLKDRKDVWAGMLTSKFNLSGDTYPSDRKIISEIWGKCERAADRYRPAIYPGKVVHLKPKRNYARHSNPDCGWEQLVSGKLDVYEMPVYPGGMLIEPFVRDTATVLQNCIDRALEKANR